MSRLNLDRRFLLLDNCLLVKWFEYSETVFFNKLFSLMAKNHCTPVINNLIKFEFLRGCKIEKHIKGKKDFLDGLSVEKYLSLPVTPEIIEDATRIANIYSNKRIDNKQIGIVDCCLSSYLKKHSQLLTLLTLDNNDFPLVIHDRVGVEIIDTGKELLVLGFYEFNKKKYEKALSDVKKD